MVRLMSFLLSFWLAALFVVTQGAHVPQFMKPLVGLAALFALFGGLIAPLVGPGLRLAGPVALSLGLFALGVVGLLDEVAALAAVVRVHGHLLLHRRHHRRGAVVAAQPRHDGAGRLVANAPLDSNSVLSD